MVTYSNIVVGLGCENEKMRLICLWCAIIATVTCQTQEDKFYAPQTYKQHGLASRDLFQPSQQFNQWDNWTPKRNTIEAYEQGLFNPAAKNDITPQPSYNEWRPAQNTWRPFPAVAPAPAPIPEQKNQNWLPAFHDGRLEKERLANILHHKQALTSDGSFRFEYASDNGLAAGEVIEPDGSRVGAYQYKDPNGQIVKLKYRAGKDGFQILEGSHLPKSPEPIPPPHQENHYREAYEDQRRQYELQQQHNLEKPKQNLWTEPNQGAPQSASNQYYTQNWRGSGKEDDGQYRENDVNEDPSKPHNFGEGYAFSFQG